jgi:hypothetical protein
MEHLAQLFISLIKGSVAFYCKVIAISCEIQPELCLCARTKGVQQMTLEDVFKIPFCPAFYYVCRD